MDRRLAVAVAALSVAGCATSAEAVKPPEPSAPALSESSYLSPQVRSLIRERMGRHAEQMTFLLVGVVLLNEDATAAFAEEIAREPKLARPGPDDADTVNALIPAQLFTLQDELSRRAQELATLAKARPRDHKAISESFGRVTETCMACHAAYLYPPDEEP